MTIQKDQDLVAELTERLIHLISETNGVSLNHTLELLSLDPDIRKDPLLLRPINEFRRLIKGFQEDEVDIDTLLNHPISSGLFQFFKRFPLTYYEEHIHLTGSLSAEFIFPRLKKLLEGPQHKIYEQKIVEIYGETALPIRSPEDVDMLIRLKDGEQFDRYLKILLLPKLILNSRKAHEEAAYHMAQELHQKYNVGNIRLKFTLSRVTSVTDEQIPGIDSLADEDVVLGLYDGFKLYQKENPLFGFTLSPSFRKEAKFFDSKAFKTKQAHINAQVESVLGLLDKFPCLVPHLCDIDTVGDERELFRKKHFEEMRAGLRRLQYHGLKIRSHHGETWKILRTGIQSVDNAMNIWHIDTLEHGLSLGINPNYYFHRIYQRVMEINTMETAVEKNTQDYLELMDMMWYDTKVRQKLIRGTKLNERERLEFLKVKFHTAREIEHYQHDVLNRMINKKVSLVALPSSNLKLTGCFPDYKDHPFSWWEKKGVQLGIGTDNYITLSTNYIHELLTILYSDSENLKITKLLMVATRETRRPYVSHLLWKMKKQTMGIA
ncbi:MAG: hypothetical protein A2X86_03670 [Bdellovibrionales bacterium GWA2_49_15]|nr:MAG: hypothetical protein A2X86_03670 [Bdellovibrionales bacterium GWA2_49_15]HAZ12315.1 hypothetical protein [Bdellovibrionales bacterium]